MTSRTILIVDDDPRNLFAIASLLERHGMEIVPATSAREALEKVESTSDLDLVLMDMMMPEIDGYEATRRLRRLRPRDALRVIALTAKAMPGDRERAIEAGCDDFVPKPVERARLIDVLQRWAAAGERAT